MSRFSPTHGILCCCEVFFFFFLASSLAVDLAFALALISILALTFALLLLLLLVLLPLLLFFALAFPYTLVQIFHVHRNYFSEVVHDPRLVRVQVGLYDCSQLVVVTQTVESSLANGLAVFVGILATPR